MGKRAAVQGQMFALMRAYAAITGVVLGTKRGYVHWTNLSAAPNFLYFSLTARATLTVSDWSRRLDSSSERIPLLHIIPLRCK